MPGFSIYVLEISRGFNKSQSVTSVSSSSTNTQSPFKSKKVVEFSERSEEGTETTDNGVFDKLISNEHSDTINKKQKWFYIGMTGDSYYPSARTAFHRISGHLELSSRSKQNQLQIALKENKIVRDDKDFKRLTIKMHHFPIKGFKRITEKSLNNETMKPLIKTQDYKNYQKLRQKVLAFESALIYELKDRLLNKTSGKMNKPEAIPYPEIYKSIIELVNNG